ncbi:hypothetical protein A9R16_011615 [Acidiferrobacter thiooxydans]|nr:hypothetical protein [Acidiferrobacter thiooxydans]UEN99066.1 hypothetical protein A9R16_011615 [Acidiferrobacter thiooxydans]
MRDDVAWPLQVISAPMGRCKSPFRAPPAEVPLVKTARFLAQANEEVGEPMIIKAWLAPCGS